MIAELFKDWKKDKTATKNIEPAFQLLLRGWKFFARAEKGSGNAWTAKCGHSVLRGPEKLTLLKGFRTVAEKLCEDLDPERGEWIASVWEDLEVMHGMLNCCPPEESDAERKARADDFRAKAKAWVKKLNKPSKGAPGKRGHVRGGYTAAQTSTNCFHVFTGC